MALKFMRKHKKVLMVFFILAVVGLITPAFLEYMIKRPGKTRYGEIYGRKVAASEFVSLRYLLNRFNRFCGMQDRAIPADAIWEHLMLKEEVKCRPSG